MSWEALEEANQDNVKATEIATMYFRCFDTDYGKVVIDDLVSKFLTKPIVRPNEDAFAQGIREGRADIVRQILIQLEYAKEPTSTKNPILKYLKEIKWTLTKRK